MKRRNTRKITVLGAGSWGSALAIHLAKNKHPVTLWGREPQEMSMISQAGENNQYLPGIKFPPSLRATSSLAEAISDVDDVLIATPSRAFRSILQAISQIGFQSESGISWASKGLEQGSNKLLHQVVYEEFGNINLAMLSGPTFALEVAQGLPTALTVASNNPEFAEHWSGLLSSASFRCYTSDDVIGAEIAAACKNIIAIAAGISDGLGFGSNARSAIITRGLREIMLFGAAHGAKSETFMGLSGIGDLTLTCSDDKSRNRRMGLLLAKGKTVEQARLEIGQSVEGIHAAQIICDLAREKNIEMPISHEVYKIIKGECSPQTAVKNLLNRQLKAEY